MRNWLRGPLSALLLVAVLLGGSAAAPGHASAVVAVGPVVSAPMLTYRPGAAMSATAYPTRLAWKLTSGTAARYVVQASIDGKAFFVYARPVATSINTALAPGHTYRFKVRGVTSGGVAGAWANGATVRVSGRSEASADFTWKGTWTTVANALDWGGHAKYAKAAGASTSFTLNGRSAALVAPIGPNRGSLKVYVDGVYRRTISLYSSATAYRQVVWQISWPEVGKRVITLVVAGTAGHPRVDIDGMLVLN